MANQLQKDKSAVSKLDAMKSDLSGLVGSCVDIVYGPGSRQKKAVVTGTVASVTSRAVNLTGVKTNPKETASKPLRYVTTISIPLTWIERYSQ